MVSGAWLNTLLYYFAYYNYSGYSIISGLVTTKVQLSMLLYRPFDPSSFSIHEAFQRGFINPITLAVRHPATGQYMSLESALTTGC